MKTLVKIISMLGMTHFLFASPAAFAQALLGVYAPGAVIDVTLTTPVAPTLLTVLIDGQEVETGWRLYGGQLFVTLPAKMSGNRHDLVLILDKPGGPEVINAWVFETPSTNKELFVSVVTEIGNVVSDSNSDDYASSAGRLDFGLGDGRFIGGISFSFPDAAGIASPAELSIADAFLEYRGNFAGDELYTRLGSHYIFNGSRLIDSTTRRGVSFRLDDLSDRYQIVVFALNPSLLETLENLTGLENQADLVYGVYGFMHPFGGDSTRLSFAGYTGNSLNTPDGIAGNGDGYGLSLSGPLFIDGIDYSVSVDASRWNTGAADKVGTTISVDLAHEFFPDGPKSLGATLELSWVEQDYYSFLDPARISGEKGATFGVNFYNKVWQWQAELGYAETNYAGDPSAPTDALGNFSAQVFYLPDDFTGGFLNGTTFYANADILTQDRLITPVGAIDPQDNTFYSFILGFDKFNQSTSYAVSYRHDIKDDRTVLNDDELVRRVNFLFSAMPDADSTISFNAELGHTVNAAGAYWDSAFGLAFQHEVFRDVLTWESEFGMTTFENPALNDGLFLSQNLLWQFIKDHNLVLSARYGRGTETALVNASNGWTFGVAIRSYFDFSRVR